MAYFYYRCGERITLTNENCTALRNDSEFDHGMVITADPLTNDVLFEIRIDKKVHSWSGSLEIGVTDIHPEDFVFPPCASKLQCGAWMLAGNSVLKDGVLLIERYTTDLDKLEQDERVGVMRTSDGDLIFYINGEPQGVAVENVPPLLYAIVDLYGKCVQVSITNPLGREHNNDECMSGSSVLGIDNDLLNVTLAGDLSELSLSSSNSLDIRMDMNVSMGLPEEEIPTPRQTSQRLHFHDRCGSLIKLSNSQRTAERRRPLDEFNNGVVMTHRPLADAELFEIRIDRLVDKWSGSIEMGVTTHDPDSLVFPATMTNMRSGTIMMSGCGILTNGKGTRREYGEYNLDELSEGDRVGLMRQPNGDLHYFINGLDQGIAAPQVSPVIWGVIDLYGMTIKVSLVDRDPREVQNLITRRTIREQQTSVSPEPIDFYEPLTFHPNCGSHAEVINNGKTAHRPNATDDFNNGVVLTSRPLRAGELFEVRLERVITKWAGSIEIGVTTHSAKELEFPFTMTNVRSGTWMMTGSGIMHNGTTVLENYGTNLDRLQVSDRVGVMRKENGNLHFFVNGNDQGIAASNVVENVYGVIDLYGQAVEATIIDEDHATSADTSVSNTTLYSELRFHHIHGKNARVINNGMTAVRPRPQAEFNDAIVFSNRPLRDDEIFEVILDNTVDRWSGSIELGVTSVKPEEIDLPGTATDLCRDTWLLSGTTVMENGVTVKNDYSLDLDGLSAGVRIGVVRTSDKILEFYLDGVAQGAACEVPNGNLYAVVDLYGRCAQISVHRSTPVNFPGSINQIGSCIRSDTSPSLQATSVVLQHPLEPTDLHRLSEYCSKGITISENGCLAIRSKDIHHGLVYSATPLAHDELFEISIVSTTPYVAGSLSMGVTSSIPDQTSSMIPPESCYLTANELHYKNKIIQLFAPNLNWLRDNDRLGILKTHDTLKAFINGEEVFVNFPLMSENLYVFVDLSGSCSKIQVTSRKVPVTPLANAMLQDSLEIVLDQEPNSLEAPIASEEHTSLEILCCTPTKYEFHDNHGRNIEISGDKTTAKRVASYNQGIVIAYPALVPNQIMQVQIEQLDSRWNSSIMCGVVCGQPEKLNLPGTAISMKGTCCIIANDWISINGLKSQSTSGERLNMLKPGSTVGLMVTETGLHIFINGECEEILPWVPNDGQQSFAIFDLYGQCQQIKIFNEFEEESLASGSSQDCEKADLEICEKEQRPNTEHLTLPIPTTSNNNATTTAVLPKISPITPIRSITPCAYQEECVAFKKTLYLPDEFFSLEEPTCICNNCYKIMRLDIEGYKDSHVIGWVKFPLKNLHNTPTDMWHLAYYGSKLSTIRCILDKGQPLTKNQMKYSNLIGQRPDDVQISFSPSLQHCDIVPFKLPDGKEVSAAFQLLVKPGSYSHSRNVVEWSTKETGAVVLQALLLKIS
ncbi:neuralized-like protein 4 [Onthophagus taurus]|uniref:neuralized-like protein 4 n=1 Tax=Onthophagus taurus TaxID=166361 RepID=UPI0039BE29F3